MAGAPPPKKQPMEFAHSSPDQMQQGVQAAAASMSNPTTPDTKYGKAEVNYRPAGSSNTRCERCQYFSFSAGAHGTGSCRIVAGTIDPKYVCDKYTSGGGGLKDLVTGQATH